MSSTRPAAPSPAPRGPVAAASPHPPRPPRPRASRSGRGRCGLAGRRARRHPRPRPGWADPGVGGARRAGGGAVARCRAGDRHVPPGGRPGGAGRPGRRGRDRLRPGAGSDAAGLGAAVPAELQGGSALSRGIPSLVLDAYRRAAGSLQGSDPGCGLPWWLLAGIGRIESGQASGGRVDAAGTTRGMILGPRLDGSVAGTAVIRDTDGGALDLDPTYDRAVGPMQFLPGTWRLFASDGNADGRSDPHNVYDAALAAGRYLCASGGDLRTPTGLATAVLSYNYSTTYLSAVLAWGLAYRDGVWSAALSPGSVPPPPSEQPAPTASTAPRPASPPPAPTRSAPPTSAPPATSAPPTSTPSTTSAPPTSASPTSAGRPHPRRRPASRRRRHPRPRRRPRPRAADHTRHRPRRRRRPHRRPRPRRRHRRPRRRPRPPSRPRPSRRPAHDGTPHHGAPHDGTPHECCAHRGPDDHGAVADELRPAGRSGRVALPAGDALRHGDDHPSAGRATRQRRAWADAGPQLRVDTSGDPVTAGDADRQPQHEGAVRAAVSPARVGRG